MRKFLVFQKSRAILRWSWVAADSERAIEDGINPIKCAVQVKVFYNYLGNPLHQKTWVPDFGRTCFLFLIYETEGSSVVILHYSEMQDSSDSF